MTDRDDVPPGLPLPTIAQIESLVAFMDDGLRIPFTPIRFGMDPILGLVPVLGDGIALAVSATVILRAREMGAPPALLARMATNAAIDFGIGAVPLVGDVADLFYKANRRNLNLLKQWMRESGRFVEG